MLVLRWCPQLRKAANCSVTSIRECTSMSSTSIVSSPPKIGLLPLASLRFMWERAEVVRA